ncbi:hypothetical protein [Neobacillus sp. LXY-4]|uniref:hypothetical protein n=1 Tax=Neobacillus sp. LXY-4 TaxID=3379826 RepID=UPI003EDF0190
MYNHIKELMLLVGYSIIVFMASIEIFSCIIFFTGLSLTKGTFLAAFVATIIFLRLVLMYKKEPIQYYYWNFGIIIGVFLIGGIFVLQFYDVSFDGQSYHQEAIYQLSNKWNPFLGGPVQGVSEIWINHFTKGPWILSAALYEITGLIETTKVFNFTILIASFCISFYTVSKIFPKQFGKPMIVSFLLAFNPVTLTQLTSFYVDGQVYSLFLIICCLGYLIYKENGIWELVMLCLSVVLLINTKFTGLQYFVIIFLAYLFVLFLFKKSDVIKRITIPVLASLIFSIAFIGYNPYVTNTVNHDHPFFPLAGEGSIDIITPNSPANFVGSNVIKNIARSLLSKSDNPIAPRNSEVKTPFTLDEEELKVFISPDVRVGGFGPLFGSAVLFSVLVFLITLVFERKKTWYAIISMAIILLSIVIKSAAWWASNTPQLWILPIIIAIFAFLAKNKISIMMGWLLIAILFTNTILVSSYHFSSQYQLSKQVDSQLDELEEQGTKVKVKFGNSSSNRIRFIERDIEYEIVDKIPCENKQSFPQSDTEYCK